ncbi:GNAT family N-acetyltransferase [Gynurincola endophyticus]|uniref:GNAT family N-acetyltransferase n=1 Tax=Gynurincola endophyticus TaxID=2479004 RepID=UPI000F8F06AF|nr:GNAT family N-acetyltransferase [Gynurincola endophyticus]
MKWTISLAKKEDAPVIQQLAYSIWPKTYGEILGNTQLDYMLDQMYSIPVLEKQLNSKEQVYYILSQEEEPLGFASYGLHDDKGTYKLHKIYVHVSTQGKGAGKSLLAHMIQTVKELGATRLILNVNRYNAGAIGFYEKYGFKRIETIDVPIGNGYLMEDYIYQLDL